MSPGDLCSGTNAHPIEGDPRSFPYMVPKPTICTAIPRDGND